MTTASAAIVATPKTSIHDETYVSRVSGIPFSGGSNLSAR
jgi:hypothetical protein